MLDFHLALVFKRNIGILQARVLCVFFRKKDFCCRDTPVDAEVWVIPCDGPFALRCVIIIAFILEHSFFREHGESVCKAFRHEELAVVVFCKFDCYVLSVGRRAFADVDRHVKDTAFDDAYEFCLGVRRLLEMEAADDAIAGFAFVVLYEAGVADLFYEFSFGEGFKEVAAAVTENLRFDDHYAGDFGLDYFHFASFDGY